VSTHENFNQKVELRRAVEFFTGFLIAIAFHEAGHHTSESLKHDGVTLATSILFGVFFLTAIRFFVGNQLNLLKQSISKPHGPSWYYDVTMVSLQSAILIFLGNVASLEESQHSKIGFVKALVALYVIDVFWIASRMMLGRRWEHWKPEPKTKWWALLNSLLVAFILLGGLFFGGIYSSAGLISLGVVNLVAFVIDLKMTDL
jgi:hypothetical protein